MTLHRLAEAGVAAVARGPKRLAGLRQPTKCSMRTDLPAELKRVPAARHALQDQLAHWGLSLLADELALAVDELLANAVLHGCTGGQETVTLTACRTARELRIAVEDPSPRQPQLQNPSSEAESGRGLALIDALCDRWGVTPAAEGVGKQVWLAMDLPA